MENMSGTSEETQTATPGDDAIPVTSEVTEETGESEGEKEQQASGGEEGESKSEGKEGKKEKPWFQTRIDTLTKDKWDARREAEAASARAKELEAQLAIYREGRGETPPQEETPKDLTKAEIERLADQKADEKIRADAFNNACNIVYDTGKTLYKDFDDVLTNYKDIGGLTPAFIEAAIETGEGPKVLYELAKDRDLAFKIMRMSPVKMGVEVAKVAVRVSQPPKPAPVSKAPAPIKPVKGSTTAEADPEKMSTSEWMAWREKQLQKKQA
jgi:hypothetical protein